MTSFGWMQVAITASAAAVAWAVTGIARRFALRRGMLDPVESRRSHTVPTPRLGGVGVLAGVAAGFAVAAWLAQAALRVADPRVVGCLLFFAVGLLDDLRIGRRGVPARLKAALHVGAAAIVVALGLRFGGVAQGPAGWPALAFADGSPGWTVAWLVAVVNLLNFMDGIDSIVATTAIVVLAAGVGASPAQSAFVPLAAAAAVLGFAAWNASPARIFLGDGGSHLVAFLVAALPCDPFRGSSSAAIGSVAWPLVAAPLLPSVVDVAEALIHKARRGIPMSQAHNDHLYQRLVKAGWSHGAVAIRYGVLALIGVVLAGPVAHEVGALAACAIGLAVMILHLGTGRRTTRGIPRLSKS